jgi:hypothetical protein
LPNSGGQFGEACPEEVQRLKNVMRFEFSWGKFTWVCRNELPQTLMGIDQETAGRLLHGNAAARRGPGLNAGRRENLADGIWHDATISWSGKRSPD